MEIAKPLISIIMPVYNTERYLREALDGILRQTYPNFELIVVDDGSTDGSGAIVDTYASRDARIHVFHRKNAGVVKAANFAASQATGEYIMRTDSDDVSTDNKLADLVACAIKHPGAAVISGNIEVIDENGEHLYRHIVPPLNDEIKRAMYIYNPLANGATMLKRSLFLEVGGYSNVFAEDFHLWIKLIDKGAFVATDSLLYRWRVNPSGLTMSSNKLSINKEKEYASILWAKDSPQLLHRRTVARRANHYYKTFKKHGVAYKRIFLFDLARTSIHLIKHGYITRGVAQLLIIASTGRTGLKVVIQRLGLVAYGKQRALLRTRRYVPDELDPELLP